MKAGNGMIDSQLRGLNGRNVARSAFVALVCAVALIGCKLNQDPYSDQPESVRNGQVPNSKPDKGPEPVAPNALRIDANDSYNFKEEIEGEVIIAARLLSAVPGKTTDAKIGEDIELEVQNLAELPGSSFDPKTGVFRWAPPRGYVEGSYSRNASLKVRLSTTFAPILSIQKTIPLFVTRAEVDPEILSIDNLMRTPTREGERTKFKVVVKDPDSFDADNMRPRLMAVSSNQGYPTAVGLIYEVSADWNEPNPMQDPVDKTKWTFTMWLDTTDKELTKKTIDLGFGLVAISRYGRMSAPENTTARIITSVKEPVISWLDTVEVYAGQENVINFSIFDATAEGNLSVSFFRCDVELPGSAHCSCVDQSRTSSAKLCTIKWKVPESPSRNDWEVKISWNNRSSVPGDSHFKEGEFKRKVRIVTPPNPPQPSPIPVPVPTEQPASVRGAR